MRARRMKQKPITDLARGQPCMIRSPVCNFDRETTVPCHLRMQGITGAGYIADPLFVAWGCYACHTLCDSGRFGGVSMERDDRELLLLRGIIRTQKELLDRELICVGVGA